jgi:hypothetical protein
MELPIIEPAPVVTAHTGVFRDLFENQGQCRHVQHELTGLLVLPTKSLAHRARCLLDSADNTPLSRFRSEAPWREDALHHRRIRFMLHQTTPHRRRRCESVVVSDDTLGEHGGSLLDDVDRHDHHREGTSALAHNPVTSFSGSGPGRFPLDLRLYRRDAELTPWDAAVATHFPDVKIATDNKARHRLHQQVDPVLLQDPEFRARPEQCRTHIALAIALREEAIRHKVPVGVVVFDACYLAEDLIQVLARRRTDWISLLKTNRLRETASFLLRDANGWTLTRPGPHIAVEEVVPLIPATAYRPVKVGEHTYGCFTLAVRIPRWGKVRLVVSCEQESLTGRSIVLVTNRPDWRAAKSISLYSQRWPTATFDRDGTGDLGFNAERMRSAEAMGKHWGLVFVAYSLLHLTCLPAGPGRTRGLIHPLGDACRQQGRALLPKLWVFVPDQVSQGAPLDQVFAQVFVKQQGMVLV